MRETEVNELRRELRELRDQVDKERAERKTEAKANSDMSQSTTDQLQQEVRKMTAIRKQQLTELKEALEDEKKARDADVNKVMAQLTEEESTRAKQSKDFCDTLKDTRRLLEATSSESRQNIYNLIQDMKTLSDHLLRVTKTWQDF